MVVLRAATVIAMTLWAGLPAWGGEEPEGLLDRLIGRMKTELERLPDYVCNISIERLERSSTERPWGKIDTLRFEVAYVAGRELYGFPGARRFQDRPLATLAGRGTIGTGQFALLAKHLFLTSTARFTYRGENSEDGQVRHEYGFDVPPANSSYKLRAGAAEATVGFQGTFWIDAKTLDLTELEVQAYDIDEKLGLSQADTTLHFSRTNVEGSQILLPLHATLAVVAADGVENLNRAQISGCRRYVVESTIRFGGESAERSEPPPPTRDSASPFSNVVLPRGALMELMLDSDVDLAAIGVGDKVSARVARVSKDGDRVSVPPGGMVRGRLVRLQKRTMPFPNYEITLEFDTFEGGGHTIPFTATMLDAGPSAGLIHQAKGLDPKFTPHGRSRMDILVHEFQRGLGILNWDARRGPIPRGLHMRWKVDSTPDR